MKNILKNIAIASVVATGLAVTSCEDMMTIDTGDKIYQNAQDTLYSYLGIMRAMQDIAERQVILGEIRGDLVSSSDYTTDTLFAISNFDNPQDGSCSMLNVSDYYNVINNCNFYIRHADTTAVRANNPDPYMLNEYAQVKAIRAWAYLQLVKNYRAVPYVTEPIDNSDYIENFDYNANLVTKDDLVDRIIADGLAKYVDLSYPHYGNPSNASQSWGEWDTGNVKVSARLCFIPIRVVLGDLYLLRGAAGDYETAARYYYGYLQNETTPMVPQYVTDTIRAGKVITESNINGWGNWASTYSYNAASNEVISLIPSASNAAFGKILTRVADIFGYTPTPRQYNSSEADDNGNEEFTTTGAIAVTPTYERQYGPSSAYREIVNQQTYVDYFKINQYSTPTPLFRYNEDARYHYAVDETRDNEGEAYPLCGKAARGGTFFYTIPTYRKTLIWLRLAEAINRAGFPEFAFAILKDGLNINTIPAIRDDNKTYKITTIDGTDYYSKLDTRDSVVVYVVIEGDTPDNNSDRFTYIDGVLEPYKGVITTDRWEWEMVNYRGIRYESTYKTLYYVTDTLKLQAFNNFLDFSGPVWNGTYGIHAKGSGGILPKVNDNEIYNYTTISGLFDEGVYDYGTLLEQYGVNPNNATLSDTINAVENIIVDELALETAFEGNRFTDLVRIAEHKNASGFDGTEWLAQKIANRGKSTVDTSDESGSNFDPSLYSKLKNTNNWYFELPKWNTK